ncbi:Non-muscle caldesmon [Galemys pyrenaicus]|uniref:Non-muscle caldesmon n=1 Tax=Galemys pyrenaicus TaxID=202257 RepID=A0A8J6AL27_GALPY|nr:Non-muscle caldesmon [Galemys pyrenaicus]
MQEAVGQLDFRIAYQRNDDDEEEAARERRRRARQERLRQKQEEESLGQVTDQVEVNAQNSVANEDVTSTTTNVQAEGDEEAALQERLARREERRQKRLQEALERQKEFDPTITDTSVSLPSRRTQNNTAKNETAEKEEKRDSVQERYEIEETEIVTKSYQKNEWRDGEAKKKEEKEKEEEEEEKPKQRSIEENQVEAMGEEKTTDTQEEQVVMSLKNGQIDTEEPNAEKEQGQGSDEITAKEKEEEEERIRAEAERVRLEAEERERTRAEQERKIAEEKARIEAEEKAAAQERERREAEEKDRIKEEERRAAEERERAKAEEEEKAKLEEQRLQKELEEKSKMKEKKINGEKVDEKIEGRWVNENKVQEDKLQAAVQKKQEEEKGANVQSKKEKSQEDKPAFKNQEILPSQHMKSSAQFLGALSSSDGLRGDPACFCLPTNPDFSLGQDSRHGATLKFNQNLLRFLSCFFLICTVDQIKDEKMKKDKEPKEEVKSFLDGKKGFTEMKSQNGEFMTHKLKHTENTFSRSGGKANEAKEAEEAGKRLEELRRRRGETESEEFEKLKQKQQEAALELEELKKKREERRKVLEEEELRRKQEEAERKVREEEEKRRLKEEIERRRAEAAEKRQKMPEESLSDDKKPFKCFTPKGSSLKIEERAEFLNKSVQKSGIKSAHQAAVVSKIDSRLEQYTSAIEGTKTAKPMKPAASDLPVPAEAVRSIKSMWEKGDVFSSPSAGGTPNKETAGLKVGVSSRINEWLTKTPDGNKSPAPKPSDLRPGDVSGKRNLWEKQSVDKVTSPTKVIYWKHVFMGAFLAVSYCGRCQEQMGTIIDPEGFA